MRGPLAKIRIYSRMLKRWLDMAAGRSYWHVSQGIGKSFVPGTLRGYFNDLTAKTVWNGPTDNRGLPLIKTNDGTLVYFPITVFQKGLGHWDRWLAEGQRCSPNLHAFLQVAQWAVEVQDEKGGWKVWPPLGMRLQSPYSAMAQGQGISVLVRAFMVTRDDVYRIAARRALRPLAESVETGGTRRHVPEGSVLEEFPHEELNGVLNGWVFALFGLYDYTLIESERQVQSILSESLEALVAYLPRYNARFWSYYDLTSNLASPFYHRLHIAQLRAMELAFPQYASIFSTYRRAFQRQFDSRVNRIRAVTLKAYQKIKQPPEVVVG